MTLTRRKLALIVTLALVILALALLACNGSHLAGACYSTYPGCEATATFIATAAAP